MSTLKIRESEKERAAWIIQNLDEETIALCVKNGIDIPKGEYKNNRNWGDWRWHIKNRLSSERIKDFLNLFPEYEERKKELARYLKSYDLSILPINLLLKNGVRKFLPRIGFIPAPNPYGVQRSYSVITREEGGKKYYLTTRKPKYATFLLILSGGAERIYCPHGCAGCYRGPQTRFHEPLYLINENDCKEKISIPKPEVQAEWLVEEWNTKPEFSDVYDILFSGGEPMMLSNETWKNITRVMKKARFLKSFRICTGSLFLGLPFRFDDEFIKILTDFRKETGIQVKISTHLSHPEHITPEAVYFARKIIKAGIEILPQIPLEPNVNFWVDDLNKTEKVLAELDRLLALVIGTRCYKWILDVQGGLSLIPVIEIWRRVHDKHQKESDIARPTSVALFTPKAEGNLNLSFHSLWAMKMRMDKKRGEVHYRIPHPAGVWIEYTEKIWKGINDDLKYLERLKI